MLPGPYSSSCSKREQLGRDPPPFRKSWIRVLWEGPEAAELNPQIVRSSFRGHRMAVLCYLETFAFFG